jgi:hypothetical protein
MVEHSRRKKICIEWLKLTKLLLITNGNIFDLILQIEKIINEIGGKTIWLEESFL